MEDGYSSGASSHGSSSDEQKISKKKKTVKSIKKWNERNTSLLIDLLKERPSLWGILDSEYTKREVRQVAYKEIAENLDENWTISEVKSKINNLRVQLGRELKKTKKTKCGQSRDELHKSSWAHWDRMQFLVPQMKSGSTKDTITPQDKVFEENTQSREISDHFFFYGFSFLEKTTRCNGLAEK